MGKAEDPLLSLREARKFLVRRDTGKQVSLQVLRKYARQGDLEYDDEHSPKDPVTGRVLRYYVRRSAVDALRARMRGGPARGRRLGSKNNPDCVRNRVRALRDQYAAAAYRGAGARGLTIRELAEVLGVCMTTARRTMRRLERAGHLEEPFGESSKRIWKKEDENDQAHSGAPAEKPHEGDS